MTTTTRRRLHPRHHHLHHLQQRRRLHPRHHRRHRLCPATKPATNKVINRDCSPPLGQLIPEIPRRTDARLAD